MFDGQLGSCLGGKDDIFIIGQDDDLVGGEILKSIQDLLGRRDS